jgi:hypothetical protein
LPEIYEKAAMELTCNRLAIDSTTRPRYDALLGHLGAAVISYSELADGYVFQLDERLISHRELSEWMNMERLCCPFFLLEVEPVESGVLELRLTGPAGSKTVLLAEFGDYLKAKTIEEAAMQQVGFGDLPWIVRIVLGLAVFNLWVSFEEFVIDRLGIWRYLPYYKFGRLCVWDLTVAIAIAVMVWWLSRKRNTTLQTPA